MINCLLIEDDKFSAVLLETIIVSNFSDQVKVVGICHTIADALVKIEELQPDLVFLDIQMPEKSGFEFIEELKRVNFEIIITTVAPEYAVEAFKINALDFLVKPIQVEGLKRSLEKYKQKVTLIEGSIPKIGNNKIGLPTSKGVIFINPDIILYCQADNTYTNVRLNDGTTVSISRSLKEVELVLSKFNFFRIHKSYLINFKKISHYIKSDGGHIMMENSEELLPISKNCREELLKNLNIL